MFDAFLVLIIIAAAFVTGQNSFNQDTSLRDDAFFTNDISQSDRQERCKFFYVTQKIYTHFLCKILLFRKFGIYTNLRI